MQKTPQEQLDIPLSSSSYVITHKWPKLGYLEKRRFWWVIGFEVLNKIIYLDSWGGKVWKKLQKSSCILPPLNLIRYIAHKDWSRSKVFRKKHLFEDFGAFVSRILSKIINLDSWEVDDVKNTLKTVKHSPTSRVMCYNS